MRKEVEVREIVIGQTSDEDALDIVSWAWSCYRRDQDLFPTSTLSFDVEEIKVTYMDFLTIGGARDIGVQEVVISTKVSTEVYLGVKDSWYQLPCRVMYGNGASWSLQVRIPVEDRSVIVDGKKIHKKVIPVKPRVQPAVIRFMETSPTLVGVGVRSDVTGTEECYSMISGRKVVLPKYVEIGTLAPTAQRMAREALAEHRYRLVVYMSTDEDEDDSHVALERASNVTNEEEKEARISAAPGRVVCLDDYTEVTISAPSTGPIDSDVDLEITVNPEDEEF